MVAMGQLRDPVALARHLEQWPWGTVDVHLTAGDGNEIHELDICG